MQSSFNPSISLSDNTSWDEQEQTCIRTLLWEEVLLAEAAEKMPKEHPLRTGHCSESRELSAPFDLCRSPGCSEPFQVPFFPNA